MHKKDFIKLFAIVGLLFSISSVHAQTHETGGVVEAEYSQSLAESWNFTALGELRFADNFTAFDRLKLSAGVNYKFWKKYLKAGISFDYLCKNQLDYFDSRYRVNASISYSYSVNQWVLSYRARFQTTFYDELRGSVRFNPKIYMRNRLYVEYAFFSKPIKLYASGEFFWRLYHPEKKIVDQYRTIVGLKYKINKRHSITVFLRADNEVQVKNRKNVYSLGIGYNFKN